MHTITHHFICSLKLSIYFSNTDTIFFENQLFSRCKFSTYTHNLLYFFYSSIRAAKIETVGLRNETLPHTHTRVNANQTFGRFGNVQNLSNLLRFSFYWIFIYFYCALTHHIWYISLAYQHKSKFSNQNRSASVSSEQSTEHILVVYVEAFQWSNFSIEYSVEKLNILKLLKKKIRDQNEFHSKSLHKFKSNKKF